MPFPNRIYLIGFSGSGKSTYGAALAEALGYRFLDTDTLIVEAQGKSVVEIFESSGEIAFRKMEVDLMPKLRSEPDAVIATGGGFPLQADNMEVMLANGYVIYLKPLESDLIERLRGTASERPLLRDAGESGLEAWVSETLRSRAPTYATAHLAIYPLHLTPQLLADALKA